MVGIRLENVTKSFKDCVAVDDVNLEIRDKEIFTFVGPSGCGKTTTLRIIAGLESPSKGKVFFDDQLVNDVSPKDRNIAMVFQQYALYPSMNVRENIEFPLKIKGIKKEERDIRVKELTTMLGIETLLTRKPHQLSGGQRQRVALGRALVRKPSVFLLDEPLSNLDAKLRASMRSELIRLHERLKITTIFVTHDQVEALTMSTRIGLMKNGKLLQVGEPLELYNHPETMYVADFLGSPAINLIKCRLIRKKDVLTLDAQDFTLEVPSHLRGGLLETKDHADLILGIRPEDIRCSRDPRPNLRAGKAYIVEPLGNSQIIHVKLNEIVILALENPEKKFQMGDDVYFEFDPKKIHLFNGETEKVIV